MSGHWRGTRGGMRTRRWGCAAAAIAMALSSADCVRADAATETIVILRHGEKPLGGYGQITCQGLNRAMALPRVLGKLFGKPDAIFAPNPSKMVDDPAGRFDYVRPLATIEPTAVAFGRPVIADLGFDDVSGLAARLRLPTYRHALVFVAWEHIKAEALARTLLSGEGADATVVPRWGRPDFDSLYVVKITEAAGVRRATFTLMREGLDGLPSTCP